MLLWLLQFIFTLTDLPLLPATVVNSHSACFIDRFVCFYLCNNVYGPLSFQQITLVFFLFLGTNNRILNTTSCIFIYFLHYSCHLGWPIMETLQTCSHRKQGEYICHLNFGHSLNSVFGSCSLLEMRGMLRHCVYFTKASQSLKEIKIAVFRQRGRCC